MDRAELQIDGRPFPVATVRGEEAVSELFSYEVICPVAEMAGAIPALRELLGAQAVLVLRDAFGSERRLTGVLDRARRSFTEAGWDVLEIVMRPAPRRLGLGRDHRTFAEVSALDVIERIFSESGVPLRVEVGRRPEPRESIAQFGESDLALFERLVQEEGQCFHFDHEDGSPLVLTDDSTVAPFVAGARALTFREDALDVHTTESVFDVEVGDASAVVSVELRGADRDRGGFSSAAEPERRDYASRAGDTGPFEVIEYVGSGHGRVDVEERAKRRLEASRAAHRRLGACTTSIRPFPGKAIELVGHPDTGVDGAYVVTRLRIEIDLRESPEGPRRQIQRTWLELHPRAVPLRFWNGKRAPAQPGVQIAEVVGEAGREIGIQRDGRVQTKMRWDRAVDGGRPVRVAQRATGDSALFPRVGWNVLTLAERGGLDEPTVLGRLYDLEHPPPYALPAGRTRVTYKTATTPGDGSTNEIAFEGAAGREEMFVHAAGDMGTASNNADTEKVEGSAERVVGKNESLSVGGQQATAIGGDLRVTAGGSERLEVHGAHDAGVTDDVRERVGGGRSLHVAKSHETAVTNKRTLRVGGASVEATLGPIATEAGSSATVMVGGVRVQVARGAISDSAGLGSALLVGGVRLDTAGMTYELKAKSSLREHVGGAALFRAKTDFSCEVKGYGSFVGGTARLAAPKITVEATGRILVLVGSSSIRVDADGVEIRGSTITAKGKKWVANGKPKTSWRGK